MEYTCAMGFFNGKYISPEFSNAVFKSSETKIDSKVSQMFKKIYKCFYAIFSTTKAVSKIVVKIMGKWFDHIF